ncbi:MAG: hypothetical protein LBD33_01460 [Puniceicoccales bacterium]|nr:hypothetical protein [Puniceicoccales bacterium]
MIKISNFVKCWRGSVVCVLFAAGVFLTTAEGASYEEEMGMSAEEVINVIFGHDREEEMYGAILDQSYEDIYGPLARFIAFVGTVPRETLDDREAFLAAMADYYAPVRERGVEELELDPDDVPPPPEAFSAEGVEPPVDFGGNGIRENAGINLMAEQTFVLRSAARILQRAMPNEFHLVTAANRREIDDELGEEGSFKGKGRLLWGSIGRAQNYTKNYISHRNRVFTGVIGCNFSNFDDRFLGVFFGISNADIDCTGQNRGTSGQQSSVCMGACGATALGDRFVVGYSSMICYVRFRCDQDLKSANYSAQNLRARSQYYGLSCFSKLSLARVLRSERYIFCPEMSLHFDWVDQSAHDVKTGEQPLFRRARAGGFYTSCEIGVHCQSAGWRGYRKIYPDIFVGYEFDVSRREVSSQQDVAESRKIGCLVAKVGLTLHFSSKLCANAWYTGNYSENFGSNGISMGMIYSF